MTTPLLSTKLYIPPVGPDPSTGFTDPAGRSGLVPRPRLIEKVDEGFRLGCRLTLISAPAGFGKTTLVSEWVHFRGAAAAPLKVAWLSLDESDNDLTRFLSYAIAALRTIEADIAGGALSALESPQPPPTETVLISLINEIAAIPGGIVLVLDDFHLIEAEPVHEALTFLLERLPPQMHLIIATREDPQLPLARLRARGQLTELRATDLRFSSPEAAVFLNQAMGLGLSAEDITALETRTEGWIAGLQLAAISLRGRDDAASLIKSFTGSHRFVLDYLIEEVLEQQSESVQTFLLQTAILNRLTGSLCDAVRFGSTETPSSSRATTVRFSTAETPSSSDGTAVRFGSSETPSSSDGTAVTEQENGQAMLDMLDRANLFIVPLDDERRWYRYHHLFSDLLRQRLRQRQPDFVATLHMRASEWYEQNGFIDEAIEHALVAEDFERAADLIEDHVDATWNRGGHAKLRRWLVALPDESLFSKPQLCIFHAWYLFARGQQDVGERSLQVAEEALEPSADRVAETSLLDRVGQQSDTERAKLRGRAAAIRAAMASYRGDVPGIIQHAGRALDYLPEQDVAMRSAAAIALGNAYGFRGDMAAAYQARMEAVEASKSGGQRLFFHFGPSRSSHHIEGARPAAANHRDLPAPGEACRQKRIVAGVRGRLLVGNMGRGAC